MKHTVSALVAVGSALFVSVGPVSAVVWADYCGGGSNRGGQYVCFHSPNDIHKALLGSSGFNGAFSPDNKSELTPKPKTFQSWEYSADCQRSSHCARSDLVLLKGPMQTTVVQFSDFSITISFDGDNKCSWVDVQDAQGRSIINDNRKVCQPGGQTLNLP